MCDYLDTLLYQDDKIGKVLLENILDEYEPSYLQSQVSINDSNIEISSSNNISMNRTMGKSSKTDKSKL